MKAAPPARIDNIRQRLLPVMPKKCPHRLNCPNLCCPHKLGQFVTGGSFLCYFAGDGCLN